MSLNKFTNSAVRKEWMNIACSDVDCLDLVCDTLNAKPVVGSVYVQTASDTVSNSTSEVNLTTSGFGSFAVPANYFTIGSSFKVRVSGTLDNLAATTLTLRFYLGLNGTQEVFSFPLAGLLVATGAKGFKLEFNFTVIDVGAAGDAALFGFANFVSQGDVSPNQFSIPFSSSVNFDTTTINQFVVSAQFAVASASNALTATTYTVLKEA